MTDTQAEYRTCTPSEAALALLKNFEQGPSGGFAPVAYRCPAGHLTIGWGHRIQPSDRFQQPIIAIEADRLLQADLQRIHDQIRPAIQASLTQSMLDALCCLAFNIGPGAFLSSTLLERLNAYDYSSAANEFLRWTRARNPKSGLLDVLPGLVRRRQAERVLFLREGIPDDAAA